MVDPTKKPSGTVASLKKPSREGTTNNIVTAWKVPNEHKKDGNKERAQHLDVWWVIKTSSGTLTSKRDNRPISTTSSTLNVNSFSAGGSTYNRRSFWPYTKRKLKSVGVMVRETNKKGDGPWNRPHNKKDRDVTLDLSAPKKPSISAMSLNSANGRVSYTIKSEAGAGAKERARTAYRVSVYRSATKVTSSTDVSYSASTEFTGTHDVADWQAVSTTDHIKVTVEAWNEGWAGNSDHVKRSLTLAFPAKATISGIDCAGTGNDDKATVSVTLADQTEHPVTLARLEVLANSEYQKAEEIPGNAAWEAVGATDDGKLKAFATTVGQLRPDRGNKTWLRVVTVNMHEPPYATISAYKSVEDLEVSLPSAADDSVVLTTPIPSEDGKSADVTVMWDEDSPNTGTELTWSADERAWESTEPPNPFDFTWQTDGTPPTGYTGFATVHVMGLTEGVKTFIRARRYYEDQNGERTYTGYSLPVFVRPVTSPNTVTLSMPSAVPRGGDIEAVWTYDTESAQTEWQLFEVAGQSPSLDDDKVLDGGSDARGSVVFSSDRLSSDTAMVYVSMSTGGSAVQSEPVKVAIVDPPTCEVSAPTLTNKPLMVTVGSNTPGRVMLVVTADGIASDGFGPGQMGGDTVWSGLFRAPDWTEAQGSYTTVPEVPAGESLFYDTGTYHLQAVVTDAETGLGSEVAEASFVVDWKHKAPEMTDENGYLAAVTVTPSDETDIDGERVIGCTIALAAPTGFAETDVLDVYRVGRDGQQLVAEGLGPTDTVFDPYAPFGGEGLAYRVVCRTANGDRSWADWPYELNTQGPTDRLAMRIDFGTDYVECERGVAPSDKWGKDFSLFVGIDGSMVGTWNGGVRRESSAQPVFVRCYEEEQQRAMESLAEYIGPCYVRVSDGSAYEAHVEVTGRSYSTNSAGVTYSLSMTELDPTGTYVGVVS